MTRQQILKRIRYNRTQYGSFAPWEMEEDDPGQSEYDTKDPMSTPLEVREPKALLQRLHKTHNIGFPETIKLTNQYMDTKKLHRGFRDYLNNEHEYNFPESTPTHQMVKLLRHRENDWRIMNWMGEYLNSLENQGEDFHNHMMHGVKMFKLTGQI